MKLARTLEEEDLVGLSNKFVDVSNSVGMRRRSISFQKIGGWKRVWGILKVGRCLW